MPSSKPQAKRSKTLNSALRDRSLMTRAVQSAVRKATDTHARMATPIAVSRGGKVVTYVPTVPSPRRRRSA